MKDMVVERIALLAKLKENRDRHEAEYARVMAKYRDKAMDWLAQQLTQAKAGNKFDLYCSLREPELHVKEYDAVIAMLEMDLRDTIELSEREFCQYVLDHWNWQSDFAATRALLYA